MTEAPPAPVVPVPAQKPGVVWAILAAFCPFASCSVTPVVTLAAGSRRGDSIRLLYEGGTLGYATLATFVLACMVLMALAALLARGTKVPVTVMMFVSVLPWLMGAAGMQVWLHKLMPVLSNVDPTMQATLLAKGIAEASACRLLGTFLASGLCAATALALGLSAIANSEKPAPAGLLAVLAAVPAFVACLLVPNFRDLGPVAFMALLPAFAFLLAAGMGGLGVAGGSRAAVLMATLGIPATLAVNALARGVGVAGMIHLFEALAMVSPDERATLTAAGATELASADKLALVAGALGALGALGLAAFAFSRAANKRIVLLEVGLCSAIALLAVGADASALGTAGRMINDAAKEPWANVPGFQPLHVEGGEGADAWVLTTEKISSPTVESVDAPLTDAGLVKLTAKLSALRQTSALADGPDDVHVWSVAVDERVPPEGFVKLVELARAVKLQKLVVVGRAAARPDTGSSAVWWHGLSGTTGGQAFWLAPPYRDPRPLKLLGPADLASFDDSRVQPVLDPRQFTPQQLLDAAAKLRSVGGANPLLVGPGGVDAFPRNEGGPPVLIRDPKAPVREAAEVTGVVNEHMEQLEDCYDKRRATNPKLAGMVIFLLTIAPSGEVNEVEVRSTTMHDIPAEKCMAVQLKALNFGGQPGGVVNYLTIPLTFTGN